MIQTMLQDYDAINIALTQQFAANTRASARRCKSRDLSRAGKKMSADHSTPLHAQFDG